MNKGITEKRLEDCNDVFADVVNVLAFGGEKVIKEENLVSEPTEAVTRYRDGKLRKGCRDVRKRDVENGSFQLICSLENQDGIDNTMPERIMGYDYAAYEDQIRAIMDENKKAGTPAYTKRIHDDQLLAPAVSLVLHWGEKEWKRPLRLHDMLKFPPGKEKYLKKLVPDYPINLINMKNLPEEVRQKFQSDFRVVAEYAASGNDPGKIRELLQNENTEIRHPEELMDVLSAMSGDERYREMISDVVNKRESEDENMRCKVLDSFIEDGIALERKRFSDLTRCLLRDSRENDLLRAGEDDIFYHQLCREYGIDMITRPAANSNP